MGTTRHFTVEPTGGCWVGGRESADGSGKKN